MQRPDIEIARDSEIRPIKEVADKLKLQLKKLELVVTAANLIWGEV